jgi:hypothetical protein
MLDYNSLFMLFRFVQELRGFNMPRDHTGLCSQGLGRRVVYGIFSHLLGLQIYAGSFETG